MAYNLIVSLRAQNEIANAVEYYSKRSTHAPSKFIAELNSIYKTLERYPFFAVKYKNVRTLKLKSFPYSLYFIVNDKQGTVSVCFPAFITNRTHIEDQGFKLIYPRCYTLIA